jgi:hypothetical protein
MQTEISANLGMIPLEFIELLLDPEQESRIGKPVAKTGWNLNWK